MPKPLFPTRRFRGIGASREEVAEMVRAFHASDIVVQRGQIDQLRALSASKLRVYLTAWREKHPEFGGSKPEKVEPLVGAPEDLSEDLGSPPDDDPEGDDGTPEE